MSSFHPTQWTLVLRSRGEGEEAAAALSELCEAYYDPVVSFLQREGRSDDEARELAHGFFQQILTNGPGSPDRERGRFRSYLLGSLKNHLANLRAATLAAKRGSQAEHVSFTTADSLVSSFHVNSDDALGFDRDWALALIERALHQLKHENACKPQLFAVLKPWLDGNATTPQATAAEQLGISEAAVKVAIHRLRVRFRELIRKDIAATVATEEEATDELHHLIQVLGNQMATSE